MTYSAASARSNGWWGIVLFVAAELTLFLMLFAAYFYLRLQNAQWPPPGVERPAVLVPTLLTLALVSTSFAMQRAWSGRSWRPLLPALAVQVAYAVWALVDFVHQWRTLHPDASAYASIHLTLLAAGNLHVLAGILLNLWLVARLAVRITPYRLRGLQAVTFFWHAVNAITVAVLLVTLSPHL